MSFRVASFTDTYLPTVNGVTYTVSRWLECWNRGFGSMDVVFPDAAGYEAEDARHEHPVRSVPFPFYEGYRLGLPTVPNGLSTADIVHAHTPFAVGLSALRLAHKHDWPIVASFHTPASEYASYLTPGPLRRGVGLLRRSASAYERWFYNQVNLVLTPSQSARRYLRETVGVQTPIRVISNGVNTDRFRPVDPTAFRDRYGLEGPLIGYTGRHGHEKQLSELLAAANLLDSPLTLVLSGDGPARSALEDQAAALDCDVRFLGFLDREELPAFYSALEVFAFPSPVETEGLVALEAMACGTPTVAADAGALRETVETGGTGYRYPPGEPAAFAHAISRARAECDRLAGNCLERRGTLGTNRTLRELSRVYTTLSSS